ncbi:hypothetical protein Leryth_001503 [Lithospermum erythrorhizon]|nr:hypothetical protein Leryth_001503 [Lithospermum erythrorhizon]
MEVRFQHSLQLSRTMTSQKIGLISPMDSVCFISKGLNKQMHHRPLIALRHIQSLNAKTPRERAVLKLLCSSKDEVPVLEVEHASIDEDLTLKIKCQEVEPLLDGACIYIVGMMGSGKTTVGEILSKSLGYSFYDCDKLIEKAAGGTSVADIFEVHGENFFRDNETEVLWKLSSMHRLVISTGGGAVIRPINWYESYT